MIEKFEKKINEIKGKINSKYVGVIIFMVVSFLIVYGVEMTNNFKSQKQNSQDDYNKSLYEIVGYINTVEAELAKLQVTTTPNLTSTTLANIWRQSNMAKENLEQLPVNQKAMSNASKYLSQLSDFSYVLMKQTISDQKITDEEYEQVASLYTSCKELSDVMQDIYDDLNNGAIKWDELKNSGDEKLPNVDVEEAVSNIDKIGKTFQDYEGLIYDGAFSEHLLTESPKFLTGQEVSKDDARKYIQSIFGEENIEYINDGEDSDGRIYLYTFEVKLKEAESVRTIYITKKDCKLYLMVSDRNVEQTNIEMDKAKEEGKEFLKKLGIENVIDTYYLRAENMAIINYAAVQNDVTLYPDLIKVKVALDNGEICSVESQGYIYNHTNREKITTSHSFEEAKKVINNKIEVSSQNMAIIPTESKNEILCFEFKGKIDEREFIIYINAETLQEEKVLLILETQGGVLTM